MATNSHINSGFRSIAITEASGNVVGANVQQLSVPALANFTLGGGTANQALSTNGSGNLSWITIPGIIGVADYLANGTSNVFLANSGPITMSVNGVANVMTLTANSITVAGTSNLNAISNVQLAGGNQLKYIQTDGNANLSWGPDTYIIPDGGYGYGKTYARGNKLWATGSGSGVSPSVYFIGDTGTNTNSRNVNIRYDDLPSFVPPLEYFVKIYDCSATIYALGNNGVLYSMGTNNGLTTLGGYAYSLTPITNSAVYGPGITVENFWAPDEIRNNSNFLGSCIMQVNDNGTRKYYGFGQNSGVAAGSLGVGNADYQFLPAEILTLRNKNLVSVSMTTSNTIVVTDTGEVWATGLNTNGQLGNGTTTDSTVFVQSTLESGNVTISTGVEAQTSFISQAIAPLVTGFVSFVRLANGTVVGTGFGANNRLASGSTTNKTRFGLVLKAAGTPLTNIVKIRSRCADTFALDSSGNLWSWGVNTDNIWGNNDAVNASSVYAKIIQTNVADFWINSRAQGVYRSMIFTKTDGTTWGCGSNFSYQLGVDATTTSNVPLALPIYYCEKGEYAVKVKTLGQSDGAGESINNNATLHLTNKNRVYVAGNTAGFSGSFGTTTTVYTPSPITDIHYY